MRVASRKGRRLISVPSGSPRNRKPRRMPDRNMPDSDRRLFIQLCVSAVLVALAVIVGVTGGGIRDGFVTMIERSADLSQVNEALSDFSVKVPVLSSLFEEGITPVFKGLLGGADEPEDEGETEDAVGDGDGYTTYVIAPEQDYPASVEPEEGEFVSGFDEEVFDSLPDVTEGEGGGLVTSAASTTSHGQPLSAAFMTLVSEDPMPEETEDGREVPENSTLKKIPLSVPLVCPLNGEVTSGFGARGDDVESEFHHGLDIAAAKGSAITAVAAGKVIEVDKNGVYGNFLVIEHEGGLTSKYAHCAKVTVSAGDRVKAGEKVATVGSTGLSTGYHLHLELKQDGIFVNPALYFTVEAQ
ncbi:MAG TPA: M23 family metallopeptidase [Candidatus Acidoferrum sp.]|nr:M23 family metallopeptidase [Candidatus Acidoferrum sp.]